MIVRGGSPVNAACRGPRTLIIHHRRAIPRCGHSSLKTLEEVLAIGPRALKKLEEVLAIPGLQEGLILELILKL